MQINKDTLKKYSWKAAKWLAVFILGAILGFVIDVSVNEPLLNPLFHPPVKSIDVAPSLYPYATPEGTKVGIVLTNNGTEVLDNLKVDYEFCYMNSTERAQLPGSKLYPGKDMTFYVDSDRINSSCYAQTEWIPMNIYKKSPEDKVCYYDISLAEGYKTRDVCQWCKFNFTITATDYEATTTTYYPYFSDYLIFSQEVKECIPTNVSLRKDLNSFGQMFIGDLGTWCQRGDIPLSDCKKYGY